MICFFSLKYLQIKWNPVKRDVLKYWKNYVWLMAGWKPYLKKAPRDRRLAWLGVNPDLSRLPKKWVPKKSVYWLHDVAVPEGSNNWKLLQLACWKSDFILPVIWVQKMVLQQRWAQKQMFWAFKKIYIFQFFAIFWVTKLKPFSGKVSQSVQIYLN